MVQVSFAKVSLLLQFLLQSHILYFSFRIKGPSRDMVLAKKSLVESEISTLTTMMAYSNSSQSSAQSTLDILNGTVAAASAEQTNKTKEAMKARYDCLQSSNTSSGHLSDACRRLAIATESAVDITFTQAQVNMQYQSAAFALNSKQAFNSFLQSRVSTLQHELAEIESELKRTEPFLGPVADSRDFKDLNNLLNETEQNLDDEWLQFQYDSDSENTSSSQDVNSVNVATSLSIGIPGTVAFGLGVNVGKGDTDLKMAISRASVKVSGELLRVTIKRPWFKPSIFEDTSLYFVSIKF